MFNLSEADKGYVGGIIDGEGCIYIDKFSNYTVRIKVSMTDSVVPIYLKNTFGGGLHILKGGKNRRVKDEYIWSLSGKKVKEFLVLIKPYLKIKSQQAEVGICLADTIREYQQINKMGRFYPLQEETVLERDKLYRTMRNLNQRREICHL
jgi:hypothetical protein